jgi:hypothetical protein
MLLPGLVFRPQCSHLDSEKLKGKRVIIIGGGPVASEALHCAAIGNAATAHVIARQPFAGSATNRNVMSAPAKARFVANNFFWLSGDVTEFKSHGLEFTGRDRGVPKDGPGVRIELQADTIILAAGFKRSNLNILPRSFNKDPFAPPFWYLQTFPLYTTPRNGRLQVAAINCNYLNPLGKSGLWHVGLYTRMLLMFVVDAKTRPPLAWLKQSVKLSSILRRQLPGAAFDYCSYIDLFTCGFIWLLINPIRWKWLLFLLFGAGCVLPPPTKPRTETQRIAVHASPAA